MKNKRKQNKGKGGENKIKKEERKRKKHSGRGERKKDKRVGRQGKLKNFNLRWQHAHTKRKSKRKCFRNEKKILHSMRCAFVARFFVLPFFIFFAPFQDVTFVRNTNGSCYGWSHLKQALNYRCRIKIDGRILGRAGIFAENNFCEMQCLHSAIFT